MFRPVAALCDAETSGSNIESHQGLLDIDLTQYYLPLVIAIAYELIHLDLDSRFISVAVVSTPTEPKLASIRNKYVESLILGTVSHRDSVGIATTRA